MSEELKACPSPWCKKSDPAVMRGGFRSRHFHVACQNCGARGPGRDDLQGGELGAITAWNTRPDIERLEADNRQMLASNGRLSELWEDSKRANQEWQRMHAAECAKNDALSAENRQMREALEKIAAGVFNCSPHQYGMAMQCVAEDTLASLPVQP